MASLVSDLDLPTWLTSQGDDDIHIKFSETRPTTKFEEACLRGHRASQLEKGAKPKTSRAAHLSPLDIAREELSAGVPLGMSTLRHCPDGNAVLHTDLRAAQVRNRKW